MTPDPFRVVRQAAGQLLEDLDGAEQLTDCWSNQSQGEPLVAAALDRCLATLAGTDSWGRDNLTPANEVWRIAGHRLQCGSLQNRARTKPLGYAGDFLMLAMFCDRFECDHPLGRLFDRYFQSQRAVEAVRSRTEYVANALRSHRLAAADGPYCAVSVGCGPAIDVQRAVERLLHQQRRNLSIHLLDLDAAALEHASARLAPLLQPGQLRTTRENLYRLAARSNAAQFVGDADFISCTGLFDYLPDEQAAALLGFLWQQLRRGGLLLVGNFSPDNPSRAYMEWIGSWYLLYRTPAQMITLAAAAGIPNECFRLTSEQTGFDLFLTVQKLI